MEKTDRQRQVETTKERHGADHYQKIGHAGGKNSPTKFNPTTAQRAANIRWENYRAKKEGRDGSDNDIQ